MSVKYVGGGGGLFSSFLPSLLQIGGPAGAAIGSGLGAAASGGSVGDVLGSAAGGYLGANKGMNGNFQNPNVFNGQSFAGAFGSTPYSGWDDLYRKINSGA